MVKYDNEFGGESYLGVIVGYSVVWVSSILFAVGFSIAGEIMIGVLGGISAGIVISLCLLPVWFSVYKRRKRHWDIVTNCDYKTQGKVIDKQTETYESYDGVDGYCMVCSICLVIAYHDALGSYQTYITPAIGERLSKQDNLICDVYVKGNDIIVQNFRKE